MNTHGSNHSEITSFLALLPEMAVRQWVEGDEIWDAGQWARRCALAADARCLARDFARMDDWETAGAAAGKLARTAVWAAAGGTELGANWANEKTRETYLAWSAVMDAAEDAASDTELAAQALTVRDLLYRDDFETLFIPMRKAGIDPDRLVADRYGPNSDEVTFFIQLLTSLTAGQIAQAGAAGQFVGWSEGRMAEWSSAGSKAREVAWATSRQAASHAAEETALAAARLDKKTVEAAPWGEARQAASLAHPHVSNAVGALVVRDLVTSREFELLFAPMRACGIDPDQLSPDSE